MKDELQKLLELDARHDELLDRLEELDQKVLGVLDEWVRSEKEYSLKIATDSLSTEERPAA